MVMLLVNRSISDVLVKVKPSLHQAFLKIVHVMNLCFIHTLINTLNNLRHIMTLVRFDEVMIHPMQFSLTIPL